MPATSVLNEQVIEAVVSGPDGANRLFTVTGQAYAGIWLAPEQSARETYTFLIGPAFARREFHRAIASASPVSYAVNAWDPSASGWYALSFESVEADWDDESGKAEMRVEAFAQTGPGTSFALSRIGFSATVLGEVAAT